MSQVHQRGTVTPEMNITPLIDVVFLLIVFFMLVNNIVSNEVVKLISPDLDKPQTHALGKVDRVVVSIAPQPYNQADRAAHPLLFSPKARYVQVGSSGRFSMGQMDQVTEALKIEHSRNKKVQVLLRADCALAYAQVQPVMKAITGAGIDTINLVAYMPEKHAPGARNPLTSTAPPGSAAPAPAGG